MCPYPCLMTGCSSNGTIMSADDELLSASNRHPAAVNKKGSGLGGVLKGLEEMEVGNVTGERLVYTV